jgi:DNA-binding NtrC family response regulator
VNCTALPETLLESELFGHARGAYTGAESSRQGRFAIVGAGTLLLDEIGDIQPPLQMKLLRVIEQRQFERLGENESVRFDARLVCTTSRNLDQEVEAGRFRRDLLGRINQIRIELPPLRERRSDIPIFARFFIEKHRAGRRVDVSPTAMEILEGFDFAMNIRQLENAIIHALAQSAPGDLILPLHLPKEFSPEEAARTRQKVAVSYHHSLPYGEARQLVIQAFDQSYLGDLLRHCGGNQVAAARQAGIDRKMLAERLNHVDADDTQS